MDAASNNSVDNIRDIRDEVVYAPSSLKRRVYIIDEVHMLSISAFNALLKTLEEPPAHVVFILATTDLQKLPATIISRCQRFDFRRISTETLMSRLFYIAEREGIELEADAARILAKLAQGGMRDAISLFELCAGSRKKVTVSLVNETVGTMGRESMAQTVRAVAEQNFDLLFAQIDEVVRSSKDLLVFWQNLISFYRDMLVIKTTSGAEKYLDLTDVEASELREITAGFKKETLLYHCKLLEDAFFSMQGANAVKRIVAELTLVRMCDETLDPSSEALLSRVAKLEDAVALGIVARPKEQPHVQEQKEKTSTNEDANPVEETKCAESPKESVVNQQSKKRILRPLRNWMEAVDRIAQSDPMVASFFKTAPAYTTEEGTILIRFTSKFAMDMCNGKKEMLIAALRSVLKREIAEGELMMEVREASERSLLDEIIESAEE